MINKTIAEVTIRTPISRVILIAEKTEP
jgi:hypothetical protein